LGALFVRKNDGDYVRRVYWDISSSIPFSNIEMPGNAGAFANLGV
jgi:hypothetical protein